MAVSMKESKEDLVSSLHEDSIVIVQRETDGYINATKMAAGTGRLWGHYFEKHSTQNVLEEIAQNIDRPIISGVDAPGLVDSRRGRNGGTSRDASLCCCES